MITATQTIDFARKSGYAISERPARHYNISVRSGIVTVWQGARGEYFFYNQEHWKRAQKEFPAPAQIRFKTTLF